MKSKPQNRRRKRLGFAALLAILLLSAWHFSTSDLPQTARLPDGTTLVLRSIKSGATNTFTHGTALEKILDFIGIVGPLDIFGLNLQAPQKVVEHANGSRALTFQFECTPQLPSQGFPRSFRFIHQGNDEFPYVQEYPKGKTIRGGMFLYLTTDRFARSSPFIRIELQERESRSANWKSIAQFKVKNPDPIPPTPFTPALVDRETNGPLSVFCQTPRVYIDNASSKWDIWPSRLEIPLRVLDQDQPAIDWVATDLHLEDQLGNCAASSLNTRLKNGSAVLTTFKCLAPTQTWKIGVRFSPVAASNQFTVELSTLGGAANLLTNFNGTSLRLTLQHDLLDLHLLPETNDLRLVYLKSENDAGQLLEPINLYSTRQAASVMLGSAPGTLIRVTFALLPSFPFSFTIQPELLAD